MMNQTSRVILSKKLYLSEIKKKDYFIVHQDNFQNKITDNLNFIIVKEFQIKIFETISF